MSSQSRRQRRAIAKQMGYLGRNETFSELLERTKRSGDFGKQLHTLHLEKVMMYLFLMHKIQFKNLILTNTININ